MWGMPERNCSVRISWKWNRKRILRPTSQWTWFATEAEKYGDDWEFYGYVKGIEDEWGYFTLSELQEVRSPPIRAMIRGKMYQLGEGLPVEREMYTAYGKVKLKDLINR